MKRAYTIEIVSHAKAKWKQKKNMFTSSTSWFLWTSYFVTPVPLPISAQETFKMEDTMCNGFSF